MDKQKPSPNPVLDLVRLSAVWTCFAAGILILGIAGTAVAKYSLTVYEIKAQCASRWACSSTPTYLGGGELLVGAEQAPDAKQFLSRRLAAESGMFTKVPELSLGVAKNAPSPAAAKQKTRK